MERIYQDKIKEMVRSGLQYLSFSLHNIIIRFFVQIGYFSFQEGSSVMIMTRIWNVSMHARKTVKHTFVPSFHR